ncbi:GrpB family protein [Roseimaritima sediminicola]|uniref:GrpB family protein n=1 Tax=Roseimaritima sediminicola TaxID=2662066 RepID=UPI00129855DB|nr:GrpB family protein [Roseimaritima sediminicola]
MNHPVRLMHYDPQWRQEFEQTRSSVLMSCTGWVQAVEHVGSTAIDGLVAQPIVDVLAGVVDPAGLDPARQRVEGLNFQVTELPEWADDAVLLRKPRHGEPTHCVYLTQIDSPLWKRLLAVRDWLREHRDAALRYEEAKVHHWKASQADRERYQQAKAIYFSHLEDQIRSGR